ncbi:MAG TPA: class I SAM-dependent methyltransferase [Bryobacteraceae bacterium]|nr:class I SAM-dependent methyltransferase [Bryobacteraceae bacterium]
MASAANDYSAALAAERRAYDDCANVHDLPPIFHYWSQTHLAPLFETFGFTSMDDFFIQSLSNACLLSDRPCFASIGAGNCDLEVRVASALLARGHDGFTIECVDLNPAMLERGRALASKTGVQERLLFTEADLNQWRPERRYQAVMANQSLHHVVNLEQLFAGVRSSLAPGGVFIVSDMIGRNGHLRWPEALAIIHEFWRELPPSYRFNTSLARYEEVFLDWDCSGESFEGTRAQDILPLLCGAFHFQVFVPFGNIIDPFIDRAFGAHFDPEAAWDRAFIDRVHERDSMEISRGAISPTHMIAVMDTEGVQPTRYPENLSPDYCIRRPDRNVAELSLQPAPPTEPYAWEKLSPDAPHAAAVWNKTRKVLEQLHRRAEWAVELEKQLEERTVSLTTHAKGLEDLLLERTEWARSLESEVARVEEIARRFQNEASRETTRADGLQSELSRRANDPVGYFARKAFRAAARRLRRRE